MKIYLDCYPCFLRQALQAARLAGGDENAQHRVIRETLNLMRNLPPETTPPEIALAVHQMVKKKIANSDPYEKAKQSATIEALEMYPVLKDMVEESDDPFDTAIRIAIAGNIIDLGVADHHGDLWEVVERVCEQKFAIDNSRELRDAIADAGHILFLADNAGETVFDRVLIETLDQPVIYAVKSGAILNDATRDDALAAGIDQCAEIIDNGSDAPGTIIKLCSDSFKSAYSAAPLIIAKGQANYETLSETEPKVFCLLQVKCPIIGRDIGAPTGSIIVKQCGRGDSGEYIRPLSK